MWHPSHPSHPSEAPAAAPGVPGGSGTALVVEDEPKIRTLCEVVLTRLGCTVLAAGTPGEALRVAEERPRAIDLLLTDVIMPEMTGQELAARLQSANPDLKCLFMSGYSADVIANRGVLDSDVNFIQKPFGRRDLAVKIRESLERRKRAGRVPPIRGDIFQLPRRVSGGTVIWGRDEPIQHETDTCVRPAGIACRCSRIPSIATRSGTAFWSVSKTTGRSRTHTP